MDLQAGQRGDIEDLCELRADVGEMGQCTNGTDIRFAAKYFVAVYRELIVKVVLFRADFFDERMHGGLAVGQLARMSLEVRMDANDIDGIVHGVDLILGPEIGAPGFLSPTLN